MIGIVIVAHGGLAREYLAAVEHVVGTQSAVQAIGIGPGDDRSTKQDEICDAAEEIVPAELWTLATYKELLFLDSHTASETSTDYFQD